MSSAKYLPDIFSLGRYRLAQWEPIRQIIIANPLRGENLVDLAFYGTLRDEDVRRLVTGDSFTPYFYKSVRAQGWACLRIEGETYPLLRSDPLAFTTFDLYHEIPEESLRRLSEYEGDEYFVAPIPLEGRTYQVFLPQESLRASAEEWDLLEFQAHDKSQYLKEIS